MGRALFQNVIYKFGISIGSPFTFGVDLIAFRKKRSSNAPISNNFNNFKIFEERKCLATDLDVKFKNECDLCLYSLFLFKVAESDDFDGLSCSEIYMIVIIHLTLV